MAQSGTCLTPMNMHIAVSPSNTALTIHNASSAPKINHKGRTPDGIAHGPLRTSSNSHIGTAMKRASAISGAQ